MKKYLVIFIALTGIIASTASCSRPEEERIKPIELIIDSLVVGKNTDSSRPPYPLYAAIPKDGQEFSITGTGEFAHFTGIGKVLIDSVEVFSSSTNISEECSGDWGKIVKNPDKKNTLVFTINPNPSDDPRQLIITIGYGYWLRQLRLTQTDPLPEPEPEPESGAEPTPEPGS